MRALNSFSPVSSDPLAPEVIARILRWKRTCERTHKTCGTNTDPALPSRVLDVSGLESLNEVVLVETNGRLGKYLALSHCWGGTSQFRTLRHNLEDRKKGFAVNNIPATFRDAIRLTRLLGFQYLWIDSLCIIQDDVADWEVESAKMGRLYRHAHITIAASRAAADTEGFLGNRQVGRQTPIQVVHPLGKTAAFSIVTTTETSGISDGPPPLDLRGWTFQETYLSRRRLAFLSENTIWSCEHGGWDESLPDRSEIQRPVGGTRNLLYHEQNVLRRVEFTGKCTIRATEWFRIVEDYSGRKLTFDTDKFPALSGIAQIAAGNRGFDDSYLAGLWKSQFSRGLCWRVECESVQRPRRNIGPSWSWASVSGRVLYPELQGRNGGYLDGKTRHCTRVVSSGIRQMESNQFGHIGKGAWVRLSTPPLFRFIPVEGPASVNFKLAHEQISSELTVCTASMDFHGESRDGLYGLFAYTTLSYWCGVVVRPVKDRDEELSLGQEWKWPSDMPVFERVGYFEANYSWSQDEEVYDMTEAWNAPKVGIVLV